MLMRREMLRGAAATAGLLVCEAVAPAPLAVLMPRQDCGCLRVHELAYGHTCVVHDERGKRWDAYSIEEILAGGPSQPIDIQTETTEWSCYCGRHAETDDVMPVGTRCIWQKTSYEYDEWECNCVEAFRQSWLAAQTTDWIAMAKADGLT